MELTQPGVNEFLDLADAPHSYAGQASKVVKVNAGETAVEFGTGGGGGAVDSVNGQTGVVVLDTGDIAEATNANYVTDAQLTVLGNTSGINTGDNATNTQYSGLATSKQDTLVSATNIKTINGNSILGSGDLSISGSGGVTGQVDIDFGSVSTENSIATTTIATASALSSSIILVSPAGIATAEHDPDDYQWDNVSAYVSNIINGVSFDVIGVAPQGTYGNYTFNYVIN